MDPGLAKVTPIKGTHGYEDEEPVSNVVPLKVR